LAHDSDAAVRANAAWSLGFVADASARQMQSGWHVSYQSYMHERHDPTDTNGN